MKKITVSFLASGRGSNFTAVAEKIIQKEIKAELGIIISDIPDAKALDIARGFGMQSYYINPKEFANRQDHEKEMHRLLNNSSTDLIVAAGYMRILTPYIINQYRNKIINIHPALLPSFPGVHGQKQALEYGVKISGCTTHFIDEGTDTGPIILQAAVPVLDNDTEQSLSARILKEEHRILSESVSLFCQGKLTVKGRRVFIKK